MLRISSCTMTVLPVPAPPNSPIFEPLANVQMRSMTLIPVSRTSTFACCSETGGAARWKGDVHDRADDLAHLSFSRLLLCVGHGSPLSVSAGFAHRFGAADDLHQLCRDARLADLVGKKGQVIDEVARGLGRVLHADHLGRVLAGLVLQNGLVDLRLHVSREQRV